MDFKLTFFWAFLALFSVAAADISLSDIQPINGFTHLCAQSYGTIATGCNMSNFFPPTRALMVSSQMTVDNCTSACRSSLLTIQSYIDKSCYDDKIQFSNESVLAHFTLKTAVDWLCSTKSGIAMSDLPLKALKAAAFGEPPSMVPSMPTDRTFPGSLPPAKTSSNAVFASTSGTSVSSLPLSSATQENTTVAGGPPQTLTLTTFSYPPGLVTGNSTILVWVPTPTVTPGTSKGVAPSSITAAPTLAGTPPPVVLSSPMVPIVNTTSTSPPSAAAPSMVPPPSSAPAVQNSTAFASTAPASSAISSHLTTSTFTKTPSTSTASAAATSSNDADMGKSSFAFVLGMAAVVGFVA